MPAPKDVAALIAAGQDHFTSGRLAEAGALYEQARALDPENAEALHALGLIAWRNGALATADSLIVAAITRAPRQAAYHDHHGLVLAALGRTAEAEAAHRRALALDPRLATAYSNLAILLRVSGRLPEALAAVEQALALDATRPSFHLNRGETLVGLNRPREAAESFAAALRLKPDFGDAYFALGQLWQRTGNHDGARFALRAYLKLDPTDRHGAQALLALIDPAAKAEEFSPAYIRNLYDGYAGRFDAHLTGELHYCGPEALRDAVARAAPATALRDVIDIGCGTGLAGVAFKPLARRLVGVDLSPAMVEHARARAIYDELLVDDIVAALARMPGEFDLVVAADVFIYLGDLAPVIAAMHAGLRAGGVATFTLETTTGQPYRLMPHRRFAHDPAHVTTLARNAGFAVALEEPLTLRIEAGISVAGALLVLRRPAA